MMNGNGEKMTADKSTMDDALNRMVAVASVAVGNRRAFIPSATWQGSKDGYYFGTTDKGTGYHLDAHQQSQQDGSASATTPVSTKPSRKRPRQTAQDLLAEAERSVDPDYKVLDLKPKAIKGAIVSLRKAAEKNELQRAQHADSPENFMESELALFQQISSFSAVAAVPTLFTTMLQEGILEQLVPLLSHDNADVALTAIKVFVEWIDSESPTPEMLELAKALVDEGALKWSVANLGRLDPEQEEEAAGIEEILTLAESLIELNLFAGGSGASIAAYLVRETSIVPWLFRQIESRQSGRAAELLSLIFQQSEVHEILDDLTKIPPYSSPLLDEPPSSSMDGMEVLLQAIAAYRKAQPPSEAECDFLENVCLALASSLTFSPTVNIDKFIDAQGIELVLRCLKEKVHAGGVALKLLDLRSRRAFEHLVEAGGLKYVFPIFVGRGIPKPMPSITGKKARKEWLHVLEAQAIQIMYGLTRYLTPDSPNDAMDRVLVKFVEEDCLKCNRLVELLLKYDQKARLAEYKFYRTSEEDDDEDTELAALNAKLKGGGDLFHRLGAIAAFCCAGSKKCHRQILDQLTLQQSGIGGTFVLVIVVN
jgi:beta-catenin-like protein 1